MAKPVVKAKPVVAQEKAPQEPTIKADIKRLTPNITAMLSQAILTCYHKPKTLVEYRSPDKTIAREAMGRAYPLGLQMGIMGYPDERKSELTYPNGSKIRFSYPGFDKLIGR